MNEIEICKRIRKYAKEGNFKVIKSNCNERDYFFRLIESCDLSIEDYVREYLSFIHPYSLSPFQETEESYKENMWVSDTDYQPILVMKFDKINPDNPMIVFFHEKAQKNISTQTNQNINYENCAVIIETHNPELVSSNIRRVGFTIHRGFLKYYITCVVNNFLQDDVALIYYSKIDECIRDTLHQVYKRIDETFLSDYAGNIPTVYRTKTGEFDMTSIGFNTSSNLELLINIYSRFTDRNTHMVLTQLAANILSQIPKNQRNEIVKELRRKYVNYDNKLYLAITQSER